MSLQKFKIYTHFNQFGLIWSHGKRFGAVWSYYELFLLFLFFLHFLLLLFTQFFQLFFLFLLFFLFFFCEKNIFVEKNYMNKKIAFFVGKKSFGVKTDSGEKYFWWNLAFFFLVNLFPVIIFLNSFNLKFWWRKNWWWKIYWNKNLVKLVSGEKWLLVKQKSWWQKNSVEKKKFWWKKFW